MNNPNTRIFAERDEHKLNIYLDISGTRHYLITRRPNVLLYSFLKQGRSVSELQRLKPNGGGQSGQKILHYVKYLVKVIADYYKYDLA